MHASDQYHVGIVLSDLDAGKAQLSELFGYVWAADIRGVVTVRFGSTSADIDLRLVYSVSTPRLELVQRVPGTVWEPAAGSGVHHIGYWSDDVAADAAKLESSGLAHEASGVGPGGQAMWAYHRGSSGPRIELVSRALEPMLANLWTLPSS